MGGVSCEEVICLLEVLKICKPGVKFGIILDKLGHVQGSLDWDVVFISSRKVVVYQLAPAGLRYRSHIGSELGSEQLRKVVIVQHAVVC
jgi:hypothetical protein